MHRRGVGCRASAGVGRGVGKRTDASRFGMRVAWRCLRVVWSTRDCGPERRANRLALPCRALDTSLGLNPHRTSLRFPLNVSAPCRGPLSVFNSCRRLILRLLSSSCALLALLVLPLVLSHNESSDATSTPGTRLPRGTLQCCMRRRVPKSGTSTTVHKSPQGAPHTPRSV